MIGILTAIILVVLEGVANSWFSLFSEGEREHDHTAHYLKKALMLRKQNQGLFFSLNRIT